MNKQVSILWIGQTYEPTKDEFYIVAILKHEENTPQLAQIPISEFVKHLPEMVRDADSECREELARKDERWMKVVDQIKAGIPKSDDK